MHEDWRNAAIDAASARLTNVLDVRSGAKVRKSALRPGVEFPGPWIHRAPLHLTRDNGVRGPFNDPRSQRQIAAYLVDRSWSTGDRSDRVAARWREERDLDADLGR